MSPPLPDVKEIEDIGNWLRSQFTPIEKKKVEILNEGAERLLKKHVPRNRISATLVKLLKGVVGHSWIQANLDIQYKDRKQSQNASARKSGSSSGAKPRRPELESETKVSYQGSFEDFIRLPAAARERDIDSMDISSLQVMLRKAILAFEKAAARLNDALQELHKDKIEALGGKPKK